MTLVVPFLFLSAVHFHPSKTDYRKIALVKKKHRLDSGNQKLKKKSRQFSFSSLTTQLWTCDITSFGDANGKRSKSWRYENKWRVSASWDTLSPILNSYWLSIAVDIFQDDFDITLNEIAHGYLLRLECHTLTGHYLQISSQHYFKKHHFLFLVVQLIKKTKNCLYAQITKLWAIKTLKATNFWCYQVLDNKLSPSKFAATAFIHLLTAQKSLNQTFYVVPTRKEIGGGTVLAKTFVESSKRESSSMGNILTVTHRRQFIS